MSCMVMSAEPLAALANATAARLNMGYNFWGFEAPRDFAANFRDCILSDYFDEARIYSKLYEINVRAYNGRYADHEGPHDEEAPNVDLSRYRIHQQPEYKDGGWVIKPWHYQLAQLLDFWLYQTAEDATYRDPTREVMQQFRDILVGFIVSYSPQYKALRWGYLATEKQLAGEEKGCEGCVNEQASRDQDCCWNCSRNKRNTRRDLYRHKPTTN